MLPLIAIPVGLIGILTGAALATGRRGLTMLPATASSPIKGVVLVRWTRFTTTMGRHPKGFKSPRGRMGAFGLDGRRLADVGFMTKAKKTTVGGETGVWVGEWKKPLSEELYLKSLPIQYASFKRSMTAMVPKVQGFVGTKVDGKTCTLSGLLGVGHLAGESGVASWVKEPRVRAKFAKTTEAFNIVNGIF
jgi:hypothetical protein